MKQWLVRIVLLVILAAAGIWVWGILFPNPERQIRKRLAEVAQAASFSGKEAPAAQAYNSQLLTTFCTDDVEVMVDFPGRSHYTVHGRDELLTGAMAARGFANGLSVEFLDINITVAPDHQTAVADLTAKGKVPGEREILAQELKMKLKKIGRNWFIQKIETVKSLSQKSIKHQASNFRETKNCKILKSHSPLVVFLSKSDLKFGYWRFPEACVLKFEAFPA